MYPLKTFAVLFKNNPTVRFVLSMTVSSVVTSFDFGHANTLGKVNSFLPYVSKASHLHIHDNHGTADEHLALGEGLINWTVVGKSVAANYDGIVVIEGRSIEEARKSLPVFRKCFL